MFDKRRKSVRLMISMAFVVCCVNLILLRHHTRTSSISDVTNSPIYDSANSSFSASFDQQHRSESASVSSCFRARRIALPPNSTLSLPLINLGFPKMGTTTIHSFFGCAGYRSVHYRCQKELACAECLKNQWIDKKEVNLKDCGNADVYSQIDMSDYFPQIELLDEIASTHQNATFFLTFRSMENWYHSLSNWPPLLPDMTVPPPPALFYYKDRLQEANITGFESGKGRDIKEFSEWFCSHVMRVREIVARYPSHRLVEIDIEDPSIAGYMSDLFDVDKQCWGRANVNKDLHSDLSKEDEVEKLSEKVEDTIPWVIPAAILIRGKNGKNRLRMDRLPPREVLIAIGYLSESGLLAGQTHDSNTSQTNDSIQRSVDIVVSAKSAERNESWTHVNNPNDSTQTETSLPSDYCNSILAHESGSWEHYAYNSSHSLLQKHPSIAGLYFPKEFAWITGRHLPLEGFRTCIWENNMLMYNGIVGHQCGCGVRGFQPSHSEWVVDDGNDITTNEKKDDAEFHPSWNEYYANSATLRLARKLANKNATLCFAGDSIDYQIYVGLQNNLKRNYQLHSMQHSGSPKLVTIMTREIRVNHTTEPGTMDDWYLTGRRPPDGDGSFLTGSRPPIGGFGSMYSILETKAWFRDLSSERDNKLARIRYFMTYGWSPWNVEFMESCNVVVMNLGLHYEPNGNHMGKQTHRPLMDDMRAAITFLTNFSSSKTNRIAIWRSALPQHFDTPDGHFYGWKNLPSNHSCAALNHNPAQKLIKEQAYNKLYDDAFASMCKYRRGGCAHLEYACNVDNFATGYQTMFKYWLDNNCTARMDRERTRSKNGTTTDGTILRWNIFDLFDITRWHTENKDCSHFCYVPSLFDSSFHRLELLIAPTLSAIKPQTTTVY